ncbi:hypothetical protein [Micromonospora wenchangensis]|uniref:hypothetical protein n=1 Tax=Micromonospora wenchangensis TaxID=1185415 RepID=UPI00382F2233
MYLAQAPAPIQPVMNAVAAGIGRTVPSRIAGGAPNRITGGMIISPAVWSPRDVEVGLTARDVSEGTTNSRVRSCSLRGRVCRTSRAAVVTSRSAPAVMTSGPGSGPLGRTSPASSGTASFVVETRLCRRVARSRRKLTSVRNGVVARNSRRNGGDGSNIKIVELQWNESIDLI